VAPAELARQLDELMARGHHFVSLNRLLEALGGGAPLPVRPVLLTFDDAYADLRSAALPILDERGIPAVVFAVAGQIGGMNDWDRALGARELALLDADGLRAVHAAGVEVGAHSVTHRALTGLSDSELQVEVAGAGERLVAAGLPRPRAFSYPYGEHDVRVTQAVGAAGYELGFTVEPGIVERGHDPLALPRIEVLSSDRGWRFRLRMAAASWPHAARSAAWWLLRRSPGA
jgi:peptidoglycan/xylan/chitin deacetylase (PgdA/CDA1 family)